MAVDIFLDFSFNEHNFWQFALFIWWTGLLLVSLHEADSRKAEVQFSTFFEIHDTSS